MRTDTQLIAVSVMRLLDVLPATALALGGVAMVAWLSLAPRSLAGPVGAVLPPWADAHLGFRAAVEAGVPLIDLAPNGWIAVFDLSGNAAAAASLRRNGLLLIEARYDGTCTDGAQRPANSQTPTT